MKAFLRGAFQSRKFWQRAAFAVACLITVITVAYAVENYRGETAWRRYEASAKAQGIKLYLRDLVLPDIPDAENFAATPTMAAMYVSQPELPNTSLPAEVTNVIAKSERNLNLTEIRSAFLASGFHSDANGDPAKDILGAMDRYKPVLDELRRAAERPQSQFSQSPKATEGDYLFFSRVWALARLLRLHMDCALAVGDARSALDDFRIEVRICEALSRGSNLIGHVSRAVIFDLVISEPEKGAAAHAWNEADLAEIEGYLRSLDLRADMLAALDGDRAFVNSWAEEFLADPNRPIFKEEFGWPRIFIPRGWVDQNLVSYNVYKDAERSWIEGYLLSNNAGPEPFLQEHLKNHRWGRSPYRYLVDDAMILVKSHVDYCSTVQYGIDTCRVACALECFRLKNGAYPDHFQQLVPDVLKAIPEDHFGKGPFQYRRDVSGNARLYAITKSDGADKEETLWPPEAKEVGR